MATSIYREHKIESPQISELILKLNQSLTEWSGFAFFEAFFLEGCNQLSPVEPWPGFQGSCKYPWKSQTATG